MVINKFGDQLYNGLEETIIKHLRFIETKVEAAQGESFLRELKLRWDHHNKSMQMIRDILMVQRQLHELTGLPVCKSPLRLVLLVCVSLRLCLIHAALAAEPA